MTLLNQLISDCSAHSCDVGGVSNVSTPVTKKSGLFYLTRKIWIMLPHI